jgi:hypothetical protein
MKTAINSLRLVYPPVSNQEAEWLKADGEVEKMLRRSDIYMIAQRREAKFQWDTERTFRGVGIPFSLEIPGVAKGEGFFSIENDFRNSDTARYEFGEKYIRVCDPPKGQKFEELPDRLGPDQLGEVLWWYSTESLLYSKWRGDPRIKGLENYRDFTEYELLYVGISTEQDSYERLLAHAHHKRVAVLSNETQLVPDARLTDEIYLFFFASDPLFIHSFDEISDASSFGMNIPFTEKQASADAEKAFTKFLDTRYNEIKFKSFPKGKQGLYDVGLSRYAHVIAEDISFTTETTTFRGGYAKGLPCDFRVADAILVTGDEAQIYRP